MTAIAWCNSDNNSNERISYPGSTCFFNTFILPAPSFYFLICAVFTVVRTWNYLPFRTMDSKTSTFLRVMQAVCILQAVVIIGFAIGSTTQGSLYFATCVEVLAWATCVYILELEAWRLPHWPCVLTQAFFCAQLIATLIFTALHAHLSTLALLASILLFTLSTSLFVFSIYKDQWLRSKNELKRLEVERFSVYKNSGSSYYQHPPLTQEYVEGGRDDDSYWYGGGGSHQHQRINGSDSSILNAISLTWLSSWFPNSVMKDSVSGSVSGSSGSVTEPLVGPYGDGNDKNGDEQRMSSVGSSRRSGAGSNAGSWFGNFNRQHNMYESDEDEDAENFDSSGDRDSIILAGRSSSSAAVRASRYNSTGSSSVIVRSVLDYDIERSVSAQQQHPQPPQPRHSSLDAYTSQSQSQPQFRLIDDEYRRNDTAPGGGLKPAVSSGVLNRVLNKQAGLSKSHSAKSLAPRGVIISDIDSAAGASGSGGSAFGARQQNSSFGSSPMKPTTTNLLETYSVSVQNWGLRRNQRAMSTADQHSHGDGMGFDLSSSTSSLRRSGRDRSGGMMETPDGVSSALDDELPEDLDNSSGGNNGRNGSGREIFTFASFRSRFNILGKGGGGVGASAGADSPAAPAELVGAGAMTTELLRESDGDKGDAEATEMEAETETEVGSETKNVHQSLRALSVASPEGAFLRSEALLAARGGGGGIPGMGMGLGHTPIAGPGGAITTATAVAASAADKIVESLDVDCELMQREFGAGAEVEFEITIKRNDNGRNRSNGGSGSGYPSLSFAIGGGGGGSGPVMTAAGSTSGGGMSLDSSNSNSSNKWVIWKTAKEIFNLHASVVSGVVWCCVELACKRISLLFCLCIYYLLYSFVTSISPLLLILSVFDLFSLL